MKTIGKIILAGFSFLMLCASLPKPVNANILEKSEMASHKFGSRFVVGKRYVMKGKVYKPKIDLRYSEEGWASWYGRGFHGSPTANGAIFNQELYTVAHPTLPLLSVVKVTNLENNRSTFAVVNDRGPFKKRRIVDVSRAVARYLGFVTSGTAKVRVEYEHAKTLELLSHLSKKEWENAMGQYRIAAIEQNFQAIPDAGQKPYNPAFSSLVE